MNLHSTADSSFSASSGTPSRVQNDPHRSHDQNSEQLSDRVAFYHNPHSRSATTRILLEELGIPYDVHFVNLKAGDQQKPEFLAINSMGKLPAITHRGEAVSEQTAITIYLADAFPERKLAPLIGERGRGAYLKWIAFYAACFEPALVDRAMKNNPAVPSASPYGDYDRVVQAIQQQLEQGDYFLGDRFTALDALWGGGLHWTTSFGMIEATPRIKRYLEYLSSRPAFKRAIELDQALIKEKGLAPASKT